MKRFLLCCAAAVALVGCNKDKFKTEPQVEIKSFGPDEVRKGQSFTLRAIVRDKEGDVQDSVLLVRKQYSGNVQLNVDTIRYSIEEFAIPNKNEIEVTALFIYGELREGYILVNQVAQDRNYAGGIIVRDKAGNRSPYVESDKILLKRL